MQFWRGVVPGGEALVLRVSPEHVPTCFLRGTIAAETATRVSVAADNGAQLGSQQVPPGGSFVFGPLCAGRYALQVVLFEGPRPVFVHLGSFVLAPGQDRDVGVLRVPEPGEVAVELQAIGGSAWAGDYCTLANLDGTAVSAAGRTVDGLVVFKVGPGNYLVEAEAADCCFEHGPIEVRSGERTTVRLRAVAGVQRSLWCSLPSGSLSFRGILRKGGVAMRSFLLPSKRPVRLSPGQWELEVELAGGRKQRVPFAVTADAEAPPIELLIER
jgi:hypothetical protein